ncbi:MAG: aminodeoxychorismate/anthranilate synthase component II [Betaproteobacteria bacterium]|nr:aminodeoxychorismate/anthranilate synthase component II [Betaproteobacteria bacterium]
MARNREQGACRHSGCRDCRAGAGAMTLRLLMIDNYDSFTYNLVQYFGELGADVVTLRNDEVSVEAALALQPQAIVISPGPCSPAEAGISVPLIQAVAAMSRPLPLLGVCLGHQSIGAAFGGQVVRAKTLMHGKTSLVTHQGQSVFAGLNNPLMVTRYHSLAVSREGLPEDLVVTAWTDDGEIMGLAHTRLPVHGVQFHPESVLSEQGHALLRNFLDQVPAAQAAGA